MNRRATLEEANMTDPQSSETRLIAAALKLAAERRWSEVSLADIAAAAGLGLAELGAGIANKTDVLILLARRIDADMLARVPAPSPGQSRRDRLFDVVMSRLDALQPHRAALRSMLATPTLDGRLLVSGMRSQAWMLEAAGIAADGPGGRLRVAGLASLYAGVVRVWLDDEDPGLAKTMAALDRRLRSGERTLASVDAACGGLRQLGEMLSGFGRRAASRAASSAGDSTDGPSGTVGAPGATGPAASPL
jgi:AcrR family transcriptional regulator